MPQHVSAVGRAVFASCMFAVAAAAQSPTVLADLNVVPRLEPGSDPGSYCGLGTAVLFAAETGAHGRELWRHDFTTGTTALVVDLQPDLRSSSPSSLVAFAGAVYFLADDGVHGNELWRTDGTAAGTTLVRDIEPGAHGSSARDLVVVGGQMFFVASTSAFGGELWCTDGTPFGTRLVVDLEPGSVGSLPGNLTAYGNRICFRAGTGQYGIEPWLSDGTAIGTTLVADLTPGTGSSWPGAFAVVGPWLVFGANSQLHRTDGTPAGTLALGGMAPTFIHSLGATAFYTAANALFTTDGTAANTRLVASLAGAFEQIRGLEVLGGRAIVPMFASLAGTSRLVAVDTVGTTQLLYSQPGPMVESRAVLGGHLYFAGTHGLGTPLYRTDGTVAGTQTFGDLVARGFGAPTSLTTVSGGRLLFSASGTSTGREPWVTDGTLAGTVLLANVAAGSGSTNDSNAGGFAHVAGITYFAAAADGGNTTLWRTDGTAAGTWAVVPPGPGRPLLPVALTALGTRVFFTAQNAAHGSEVWVSDGTAAGTRVVVDVNPGAENGNPTYLTAAGDRLYFLAYEAAHGRALWRTDGTPAGTWLVTGHPFAVIEHIEAFGTGLLMSRNDFTNGYEPFYTDGSPGHLVPLADLAPGALSSNPKNFAVLGDRCFFTAVQDSAIYVTDGTPGGTQVFLDLQPGTQDVYTWLRAVESQLFFGATTPSTGLELWRSDGTVAGSRMVLDSVPGSSGTNILPFGSLGSLYLYLAQATGTGSALWRSDGTAAGTFPLTAYAPNYGCASDGTFAWFTMNTPGYGLEPWRTNGSVAGTTMVADLFPGVTGSDIHDLAIGNGSLLFGANDPVLGVEPWVMPLGASVLPIGEGCFTTGTAPRLDATPPRLGTTLTLRGSNGPDQGFALTLFSFPTAGSFRLPGGRCDLFLAPAFEGLGFSLLSTGGFMFALTVPGDPVFAGLQLRLQSLLFPGGTLVGVEATNALQLGIGP